MEVKNEKSKNTIYNTIKFIRYSLYRGGENDRIKDVRLMIAG